MQARRTICAFRWQRFRRAAGLALAGVLASSLAGADWGQTDSADAGADASTTETQPAPEHRTPSGGGGGVKIVPFIDLTCLFTGCGKDKATSTAPGDAAQLAKLGPKIPDQYSMSGLVMQALARAARPSSFITTPARLC